MSETPYTGAGYFKFAFVNAAGDASYWSNDNTSSAGSEPTAAVQLTVANGLFTVLLGDTNLTNMTQPLAASVFSETERYLRIWFSNDNVTFTLLTPDQRVAAVPYALQAAEALNAVQLDGQPANAYQLRVSGACAVGYSVKTVNADGTVLCQADAPLNRSLAPQNTTQNALDSTEDVGKFTSITLGVDGLGLISYYDLTNNALKVAHCNDTLCSSAATYTLDSDGDVGWYTSITIGMDGLGLAVVLALALVSVAVAFASGSGPTIDWWVFSGGGGGASSGSVTLDSTLGQPVAGVSTGDSTWLGAGYWYAEQPVQLFLPMLRR